MKKKVSAQGLAHLAQMVKHMPGQDAKKVMAGLSQSSPLVASALQGAVFTFDRLMRLDSRSLQVLVRAVDRTTLAMALKGEREELRLKIFSAMTGRGADLLKDEIEDLGLQPAGKVGEAQKAVVAKAEELAARGEIVLPEEAR